MYASPLGFWLPIRFEMYHVTCFFWWFNCIWMPYAMKKVCCSTGSHRVLHKQGHSMEQRDYKDLPVSVASYTSYTRCYRITSVSTGPYHPPNPPRGKVYIRIGIQVTGARIGGIGVDLGNSTAILTGFVCLSFLAKKAAYCIYWA